MSERCEVRRDSYPDRNEWIERELERGVVPVMEFEVAILKDRFNSLVGEQSKNAFLLGESMQDSSETWHDNAAAEMISAASHGLSSQANALVKTIIESPVCEATPEEYGEVTLGSLVFVSFSDAKDVVEPLLITGVTSELPDEMLRELPDMCEAVTVKSPLGRALLGAREGDEVSFSVNGRILIVQVHKFDQL